MQTVKVNDIGVTIRPQGKPAGFYIGKNYKPNHRWKLERIISLSNPSSPYCTQYNAARRLLA
ncbi:MAG: hypothetical protein WC373_04705 [Smithella sp.]